MNHLEAAFRRVRLVARAGRVAGELSASPPIPTVRSVPVARFKAVTPCLAKSKWDRGAKVFVTITVRARHGLNRYVEMRAARLTRIAGAADIFAFADTWPVRGINIGREPPSVIRVFGHSTRERSVVVVARTQFRADGPGLEMVQ